VDRAEVAVDNDDEHALGGWGADIASHKAPQIQSSGRSGLLRRWRIFLRPESRASEARKRTAAAEADKGGRRSAVDWGLGDARGGGRKRGSPPVQLVDRDHPALWSLFGARGLDGRNISVTDHVSLNIPGLHALRRATSDFRRSSGQSIPIALTMTAFSSFGIAVTAATIVIYGQAIWDPVAQYRPAGC